MRALVFSTALLVSFSTTVAAQQTGPIIAKGGSHAPVPNPTFGVPTDLTYRMSWNINTASAKPAEMNTAYDIPARFLNQSAVLGVPRANVHVAIVVHGSAGEEMLSNAEYRARKGVDNPNIAVLEEMAKAGVRIILCGQTVASRKMPRDQILPFVLIAPSAALAHAVLGQEGFRVNPF